MRVLLTSTGLETPEIKEKFIEMAGKPTDEMKALFIPTAAIDAGAIGVLPKCMNDLLSSGIKDENITVFDLHRGMDADELRKFDVVYFCGGTTRYLLERINDTGFHKALGEYINDDGFVLGVSAGSIIFANNHENNLGLIDTKLDVHCESGDETGKVSFPLKANMRLTNSRALVIRAFPDDIEIIGR